MRIPAMLMNNNVAYQIAKEKRQYKSFLGGVLDVYSHGLKLNV